MTQKELASALGRPVQVVNEIINARKAVTEETALGLERVLGIAAHVWTGLESTYRMTLARNREREQLRAQEDWLSEFPCRAMMERGWIAPVRDKEKRVGELLRFFGVANVAAYRQTSVVGLRFSGKARVSEGALAAWLRQGEIEARRIETLRFNTDGLHHAAIEARSLTTAAPDSFVPRLRQLFAEAGVAFVIVPELPMTGANGAARWLNPGKALIQMNLRYKWTDIFWFTLFHEIAHLLMHRRRRIIVDGSAIGGDPAIEKEANCWAADFLIPHEDWRKFAAEGSFTRDAIIAFAQGMGIASGIVTGRLQRENRLPYSRMVDLKERFAWTPPAI